MKATWSDRKRQTLLDAILVVGIAVPGLIVTVAPVWLPVVLGQTLVGLIVVSLLSTAQVGRSTKDQAWLPIVAVLSAILASTYFLRAPVIAIACAASAFLAIVLSLVYKGRYRAIDRPLYAIVVLIPSGVAVAGLMVSQKL